MTAPMVVAGWHESEARPDFENLTAKSIDQASPRPQPVASNVETEADTLSIEQAQRTAEEYNLDRSLMQLQFERLLDLPPTVLANILSTADTRTVLFALAGASPQFMKRFNRMLDRRDRLALDNRIKQIGVTRVRDLDEAQQQLLNLAQEIQRQPTAVVSNDRKAA